MFVTMPQFEERGMSALAAAGQKYWRAVVASFPVQPWYMFVFEATVLDSRVNQTMLVAWEESLIQIIDLVPAEDWRMLYRVDPSGRGGIALSVVQSLWAPTAQGADEGLMAVMSFEGRAELFDPHLHLVPQSSVGRLVYQAPTPPAPMCRTSTATE